MNESYEFFLDSAFNIIIVVIFVGLIIGLLWSLKYLDKYDKPKDNEDPRDYFGDLGEF